MDRAFKNSQMEIFTKVYMLMGNPPDLENIIGQMVAISKVYSKMD